MIIARVCSIGLVLALACPVAGQQDDPPMTPTSGNAPDAQLQVLGSYQFEASIDSGGDMDVARLGGLLNLNWALDDVTSLNLRFGYQYSDYSFNGPTSFGADKLWDDVGNGSIRAMFTRVMNDDLSLWGGGFIDSSMENGADFGDSITGGGVIGVTVVSDEDLTLGFGLAVSSQLQDSAIFWPVPVVNWEITDTWALRTRTPFPFSTGAELSYDLGQGVVFGFGAAYRLNRFRLDDSGLAPEGVGEEKSLPVWARVTFELSNTSDVTIMAGFVGAGHLEVELAAGGIVGDQDYDPAGLIGVLGSFRF